MGYRFPLIGIMLLLWPHSSQEQELSIAPAPGNSNQYNRGFEDAQRYGQWWQAQKGEARDGARVGAIRASILDPQSPLCAGGGKGCVVEPCISPGENNSAEWISACQKAQKMLVPLETEEWHDQEYKRGADDWQALAGHRA